MSWNPSDLFGRCRHLTFNALPSGWRAKRKQKRKSQRKARRNNR